MFRVFLALIVLVSVGCSKQELQVRAGRKAGWTDAVYKNTIDNCMSALDKALDVQSNDAAICECYATALSITYTVEELNTKDYAIEKASQSTLVSCGEKSNEKISYNARSFILFREPMADENPPEAVKNTLSKVKKKTPKPSHAVPAGGPQLRGTNLPADPNRPPLQDEAPDLRGKTPAPAKVEAVAGNATVKYVGYNGIHGERQSESFVEKDVAFTSATCAYDHWSNSLRVELKGENVSQSIRINHFDESKHHYSMSGANKKSPALPGDDIVVTYTHDKNTFAPSASFGGKSEVQVTDVKIEGAVLSAKFSFVRLLGATPHDSASQGQSSYVDMEGTITCAYSTIAGPPLKVPGPRLIVPKPEKDPMKEPLKEAAPTKMP